MHTCNYCGCTFEFELEDCKKVEKRLNGKIYIECPTCKTLISNNRDYFASREVEVK